jgi:hypothetical protein
VNEPYVLIYGKADQPDTWPRVTRECLHIASHAATFEPRSKSHHRPLSRAAANRRADSRCGNCLRRHLTGELP